jgi:hypothetical protein
MVAVILAATYLGIMLIFFKSSEQVLARIRRNTFARSTATLPIRFLTFTKQRARQPAKSNYGCRKLLCDYSAA